MTINSTRRFLMETPNLVCEKPIFVVKQNSIVLDRIGVNKYSFQIHHLQFIVETVLNEITEVNICSALPDDKTQGFMNIEEIRYGILYHMLTLLEYNHLNFKNEQKFITKLLHYVSSYISNHELHSESDVYVSQYFRITVNNQIGILFKHDESNTGIDRRFIGRVLRTMGTFNIALFGALHKSTWGSGRRYSVDYFYPPLFQQNQQFFNRVYDIANAYRKEKSNKDAPYKQRTNMILNSLNNDDIQELINISLIPFIGQCAALSDIKLLFKNIKSQSTQPQKACFTMSTPSDPTTVTVIVQKTSQQENKALNDLIKRIEYLRVHDYMSAKEFTGNVLNDEGYALVSIKELLECTNSTDRFLELAKSKVDTGELIDTANIGHTVKYSKLVIRHNHKTKGYSIGKDKVQFKDFDELCGFLADAEKLISLFCVNKAPKKEIPEKTEEKTKGDKRETMVAYVSGKIYHRSGFGDYRSQFKMLDFLTQNSLWPDLNEKLKKLMEETPEMHMFNSVPESIKIEKCHDKGDYDGYDIYVSCSYNQQDEHFTPIKVFRNEIAVLNWLMNPINLVKKFDKDGNLITQKQTNLCKRTMFDTALNEYLRSNTSIPYKKGIVYHPLNLKDFAMWYCGKKGGHDSQLLNIFNAPTVHLGNYRFFVDNGEARNNHQYLYSLRAMSTDTTSIDWTTNVTDIFSFLFDNYVKSGHA